jgi:arylsulfatase A-like enzyme
MRGEPDGERPIYSENHEMPGAEQFFLGQGITLSLIQGPWKYILNVKSPQNRPRPRHELYRLDADFAEQQNLASEQPELIDKLEAQVLEWWARNRARRQGVDVKSLTIDELRDADPETLERLRRLGYVRRP